MTELLVCLLLVSLWVAAWLHWIFAGELRQFFFAYFTTENWRGGRDKRDVMTLGEEDFEMFLQAESGAWGFIRGVLGCPGCLSTYISAAGTAIGFFAILCPAYGLTTALWLLPLVWAPAAWVGHRLHHHI